MFLLNFLIQKVSETNYYIIIITNLKLDDHFHQKELNKQITPYQLEKQL